MKKIIIYSLREKSNKERCKILQKLFGYIDKSNKGQYQYKREGLLKEINFKKKNENVLYFKSRSNQDKALKILKESKIKISYTN